MSPAPELPGIEFIRPVGKGAMGAVYLARQVALGRTVAVKQILGAWQGDVEALERFRREARALARMSHPNVVALYDLATGGSDLFMVMEFVEGVSLKDVMDRGPLNHGQAMRVLTELAAALDYAHQAGIVHRDLKPANVFVNRNGHCKLGDFGLVKMTAGAAGFVTQVGAVMGTPAYMSPEQAKGLADIDGRADVYALGIIAYQLLVGRLPFPPIAGNMLASLDAQVNKPPPPPSSIDPAFPPAIAAPLLHALEKDPAERPATAGAYVEAIRTAAAGVGWEVDGDLAGAMAPVAAGPAAGGDATVVLPGADVPAAFNVAPTVANLPAPVADTRAFTRRRGCRDRRIPTLALLGLGLLLAGYAALQALRGHGGTPAELLVSGVSTEVSPSATGPCRGMDWTFTGHITTNGGAGPVYFRWLQPDGNHSREESVGIPANSHVTDVVLKFHLDSTAPYHGQAGVEVTRPSAHSGLVNVQLSC